ncbi:MAG TPA: hypothetical protein VIZ65_15330 [Cellvibrionaceae bacterium]
MLRYPSTKQILTVAVLSALLAGCGKDSKKATADSNIMDTPPMAERPEASIIPVELGREVVLTEESDVARQDQSIALAAIVLSTTLNMDSGSTAVKQAISAFAGAQPRDTATGALSQVIGGTTSKCSKKGTFELTLLMGEGKDVKQTGAFNHEEVYFDADFAKCDMGSAVIDGGLGMGLTLGIAELINSAQFRIETSITAQNLHVTQGKKEYFANGVAGYKFYTNNGYELNNELYADQFDLNAGMGMSLIDLHLLQTNNTATNAWTLSLKAKYQAGATYVNVFAGDTQALQGKGYGYPYGGQIDIYTKAPQPGVTETSTVTIKIEKTADTDTYPEGSYVSITVPPTTPGGTATIATLGWADIEGIVKKYIETKELPDIENLGGGSGPGGTDD